MGIRLGRLATVAVSVVAAATACSPSWPTAGSAAPLIGGPYASLLAASHDLGPSRSRDVQITVSLGTPARPQALIGWAAAHGLAVRWHPGQPWAVLHGAPTPMARALGLPVHDYRGRRGQVFYASTRQPVLPSDMEGEVSGVGRLLGYAPYRNARPPVPPRDIAQQGLSPASLMATYHATPLAAAGHTGKSATIVVFAFDGYNQSDLDSFAQASALPRFTPVQVGGSPGSANGETVMDLQIAHAIAPDARLVVVNARPTVEGDGTFEKIAAMFDQTDRAFPGAVWSMSIGWGCDSLFRAADLAPVRSALTTAHQHGTAVFDASGDMGGLECKGGEDFSAPPGPNDIGVDAVASLPEVTSVGGTTLNADAQGGWLGELAWTDVPMSLGASGGVAESLARPLFQRAVSAARDSGHRLVPDVSAVADPSTGVRIFFDGQSALGGGTSQAAPIWAAMTVLMNQYVVAHGGKPLGDFNPLLYRIAAGSRLPGFHDVTLGGNAVDNAGPGYDLVTGLGTPDVANLAADFVEAEIEAAK